MANETPPNLLSADTEAVLDDDAFYEKVYTEAALGAAAQTAAVKALLAQIEGAINSALGVAGKISYSYTDTETDADLNRHDIDGLLALIRGAGKKVHRARRYAALLDDEAQGNLAEMEAQAERQDGGQ